MKIEKINISKRNAIVNNGIEYHIYGMTVYPYLYFKKRWASNFTIPIIVEFNSTGKMIRIGSYEKSFNVNRDGIDVKIYCLSSLHKGHTPKSELIYERVPIKSLMKEKWGDNFLKNILLDLYDNNNREIPHTYWKLIMDLNEYSK